MTKKSFHCILVATLALLSLTQYGFSQEEGAGDFPPLAPPPFEMNDLPMQEDGLLPFIPQVEEEEDDKNAPPKWEPSTLEAYEEAATDEYSDEYIIEFKNKSWHTKPCTRQMPRQRDGMLYFHYMSIDIFVRKEGEPYMRHGTNQKQPDVVPVPDPGIPLDEEPQLIIIFPPANPGESEIVRQYPFKERC